MISTTVRQQKIGFGNGKERPDFMVERYIFWKDAEKYILEQETEERESNAYMCTHTYIKERES